MLVHILSIPDMPCTRTHIMYTQTLLYTALGTLTRHSPVHSISCSRTNTSSSYSTTSLHQTPLLIRGTPVLRIIRVWVVHTRTHTPHSWAGGGGLEQSPLGNPGVATTPCSAFFRQPRCWRRGEEGSWNNKGKLGRAQGGAAPARPRGEPCTAGSLEAPGLMPGEPEVGRKGGRRGAGPLCDVREQ